jgi:hypothetical protein
VALLDPAQLKLADPITRDESGNVIPPSKRFQPASPDIRFAPAPLFRPGKVTGERKSTEALKNSLPAMPAGRSQEPQAQRSSLISRMPLTKVA